MTYLLLILIIIFSLVLIRSADMTVVALRKITGRSNLTGFSAIIIAVGTSFPELFVAITSAIEKAPGLALGVALGSNIANIALIGAGAAIISGRVVISESVVKKIVWISLACGLLPYVLLLDGNLNRVDGMIMIFTYISYTLSFFKSFTQRAFEEKGNSISFTKLFRKIEHFTEDRWRNVAGVFIGIALMLFSADTIVKFSFVLATKINIPIFVIGLFVLAIGTSLPEFAFSIRSLRDHEPQMFIGNIFGSVVANTTLIIGLAALISPMTNLSINKYVVPGIAFIFVYLLFFYFVRTKKSLDRWEAGILLIVYVIFFLVEFI